jgi:hypothetical protein
MSEEPRQPVEKMFEKFMDEYTKKRERNAVPEVFENMFQAMEVGGASGDAFSLFGTSTGTMMAVCKKCGAVVYPTALDRHSNFHEKLEE